MRKNREKPLHRHQTSWPVSTAVVVVVWTNVDDVSMVSHVLPLKEKCTDHWGGTNDLRDSRH